jgi:CubicO group peptidase (beta-lactamase class C family)
MADPVAAGAAELEARLASFVTENRLPGAAAGVVHGDELAWSAGIGFADTAARRPTRAAALYRIASITKTFTGSAILQLRDAGRLDLDDPAVAYLPELRGAVSPFAPIEAVTIRRMLDLAPAMSPVWAEGGLWSCVQDLATWVCFQLRAYRDPAPDSPVLAASLREMHKPRYLADDDWTRAWGISWCANRLDGVTWIQHSGGLPGFTSTVCFDPVEQVGAIALVNGTHGTAEIGFDLASIARRLARAAPPVIEPPAPTPGQYRPLLGIYARPELGGWLLRLEWRDGNLAFHHPGNVRMAAAASADQ